MKPYKYNLSSAAKKEASILSAYSMVEKIVKRLEVDEKYYEDLIQVGMLGVVEGIHAYESAQTPLQSTIGTTIYIRALSEISKYLKTVLNIPGWVEKKCITQMNAWINTVDNSNPEIIEFQDITYLDDRDGIDLEESVINHYDIESALNCLSKTEQYVIIYTYGLFGQTIQSDTQIAAYLKTYRSYVYQIRKRALKKLKNQLKTTTPLHR